MKKKFMNFLEKLSRNEMRTITGGYSDYETCVIECGGNITTSCWYDCQHLFGSQYSSCMSNCQSGSDTWCENYCAQGT